MEQTRFLRLFLKEVAYDGLEGKVSLKFFPPLEDWDQDPTGPKKPQAKTGEPILACEQIGSLGRSKQRTFIAFLVFRNKKLRVVNVRRVSLCRHEKAL